MVAKGIWSKGKLIKEIRWFNGGVMTELKRNESDSLDSMKRIPIYVGGFRYDEEYAKFVKENDAIDNESKSFHILNCESLKSIRIGEYSFSDYAGDFELKNLPRLQSIQIGTIRSESCNFLSSSFVIQGIDMILII